MSAYSFYIKDIVLGACLFLIPFIIPAFSVSTDVGTLVTATSAVFAVVAGFFIADSMSNYLRLQTLISEENAALISLADYAKKIDAKHSVSIFNAIDGYLIAQLDSDTLNHILQTEKQIDHLNTAIDTLKVGAEDSESYERLLEMREKILTARQEILFAAKKNLTLGHWVTLIVLAALVACTVLAIRDGGIFMNVIAGSMIIGTQAILVLLRDMDNNRLLEMKLGYDNPQEVFHALSMPPYYPHFSPPSARIPDDNGIYRLGRHDGLPQSQYEIIDTKRKTL